MDIRFISSFAVITADPPDAKALFVDALGLDLQDDDGYLHSEAIDGARHFGVWPLAQAAQSCFGTDRWPEGRPVPQASVEFELDDPVAVERAAEELTADGFELLHAVREEPWGQTVGRFQSADGAIVALSYTPWMH